MQPDITQLPIRDIHLPQPVSWWPPAPGWWLLLALMLSGIALAVWLRKRRRLYKLRDAAMAELDAIYQTYQGQYDARRFASELSVLLRRVCISYFPANDTAGLTGAAWLDFLDSVLMSRGDKSGRKFSDSAGGILIKAPYQNKLKISDIDVQALYQLSAQWIESLGPARLSKPAGAAGRREAAHVSV